MDEAVRENLGELGQGRDATTAQVRVCPRATIASRIVTNYTTAFEVLCVDVLMGAQLSSFKSLATSTSLDKLAWTRMQDRPAVTALSDRRRALQAVKPSCLKRARETAQDAQGNKLRWA
jgi:hypothetical protein